MANEEILLFEFSKKNSIKNKFWELEEQNKEDTNTFKEVCF